MSPRHFCDRLSQKLLQGPFLVYFSNSLLPFFIKTENRILLIQFGNSLLPFFKIRIDGITIPLN